MAAFGIASDVLGAMIAPTILVSAVGTLVLSTSNRLSRVVDRVRTLSSQAAHLIDELGSGAHLRSDQECGIATGLTYRLMRQSGQRHPV